MYYWRRFQIPIIIGLAVLFIFTLISINIRHPHPAGKAESLLVGLTAPVLNGLNRVGMGIVRVWRGYFFLVGVQAENELLHRQIAEYRQQEIQFQEARLAQERLEKLLELKGRVASPVTAARVIGYDPSPWFKSIIVDKGETAGIRWGMAVIHAHGVVGRVIESYASYAKVMLLIDRNSAVDALVQRNRQRGILEGVGGNLCHLRYVLKNSDVQAGDVILTSGLGGIFPAGMILGEVVAVDKKAPGIFQDIEVKPAVDLASIEEVVAVAVVNQPLQR